MAEDTLARRRRVLGEDHPDTLASADNLAISLLAFPEQHQAARELGEDTLARRRRVLGEDHPDTWTSASNLVMILGRVGEHQAARELAEDTLARRRRVLGEDHPDTLTSAFILAAELSELGEYRAAKELNEDTLARRRRVLGEDHPDTLASAAFAFFLRTPRPLLKTISWIPEDGVRIEVRVSSPEPAVGVFTTAGSGRSFDSAVPPRRWPTHYGPERMQRARCVPDRPVNTGNSRSLPDSPIG